MTTKYVVCKKQANKQLGFFSVGIGLGLFLLFGGTAAVLSATSDKESKETVAMQKQASQSQYYTPYEPGC